MKKLLVSLTVLGLLALVPATWAQCCAGRKADKACVACCAKCGEVAGSEKCCAADAEICPGCGLHKGSPGCKAKCAPALPES